MKRICVFCGSSPGTKPEYLQMARLLGEVLVQKELGLVYGGGKLGMMGEIAQVVMENGGEVIGVIPRFLAEKEVVLREVTTLHIVDSMHERKALMAELADGFIALPGGLGTIEEFFEVLTWAQLGIHHKPCGLLNIARYYDQLIRFLDHAVDQQFIKSDHRSIVLVDESPEQLLKKIETFVPVKVDKAAWALGLKNS